jgi:glycosyltransferase involved in cell wall biosynthesis
VVINPPVDLPQFKNQKVKAGDYFLTGGRLEAAKNFDLIIKACNQLKVPLKIYGTGSQEEFLKSISGSKVEFLGGIDDQKKFELMRNCRAFVVMATDEDFGITPVEAMATGRPVIAFKGGGYLETVIEGKTGVFLDQLTVIGLAEILNSFKPEKYKPQDCQAQAQKFSKERFKEEIKDFVQKHARTSRS